MTGPNHAHARVPWYRDVRVLGVITQFLVLGVVLLVGGLLLNSLVTNMADRGLAPSLGFLDLRAGFAIAESVIPYSVEDSYGQALVVGLLNTLMVSIIGIALTTILGLLIGVARLSRNWLVNKLALGYVELFRNTPLLVQLFFLLFIILELPPVRESLTLPGSIYLSQRGLYLPRPELQVDAWPWLVLLGIGIGVALTTWVVAGRREAAGRPIRRLRLAGTLVLFGLPIIGWILIDPISFELPVLGNFNLQGGLRFSPQFAVLMFGLALYHAAFIAEIVRGGIQSVSKGQLEASRAIGLKEGETLRLVVLPQALRVIVPPVTSEYLSLIKNSSLALVIGYQDLFSVSRTISEQTGSPVSVIIIVMAFYLVVSLITSAIMNVYNRSVQLAGR